MNISSFLRKNSDIFLFLLSGFCFIAIFLLGSISNKEEPLDRTAEKLSSAIQKTEKILNQDLTRFVSGVDTLTGDPAPVKENFKAINPDRGDFFYMVFSKNDLLYWNTNEIVVTRETLQGLADKEQFHVIRLQNGWYGVKMQKTGKLSCLGGFLIKRDYPIQNDYISNRFADPFHLDESLRITDRTTTTPVVTAEKKILFYLENSPSATPPVNLTFLLLSLFLAGICFLFFSLYQAYHRVTLLKDKEGWLLLCFTFDIALLRFLQYSFRFPQPLYSRELFGPGFYASSLVMNSLGDYMVMVVLLALLAYLFFCYANIISPVLIKHSIFRMPFRIISFLLVILAFQLIVYLTENLVINSSFSLNLQNIAALTTLSGYGLFIICCLFLAFWFFSSGIIQYNSSFNEKKSMLLLSLIVALVFNLLIYQIAGWEWKVLPVVSGLSYGFIVFVINRKGHGNFSLQNLLLQVVLLAACATLVLNDANRRKEQEKRKIYAMKLASRRNPVTETLYESLWRKMKSDTLLSKITEQGDPAPEETSDTLSEYLSANCFTDYWSRFNVQVTRCNSNKNLRIQPQGILINCHDYFQELIHDYGESTPYPDLYFLDYGFGVENYLVVLSKGPAHATMDTPARIFIELSRKTAFRDQGYPELLLDRRHKGNEEYPDYSYGLYQGDRLVYGMGDYAYKTDLRQYLKVAATWPFFVNDGMEHYYYRINGKTTLLISKTKSGWIDFIAPFSYFFLLFSITSLLVFTILKINRMRQLVSPKTLRDRLLIAFTGILIIIFLIIGIVLITNLIKINHQKNEATLQEKALSVMTEMQHRYSETEAWQPATQNELNDFLVKLSNIFFTDINFYDLSGQLLATSRPQIFDEGLLSRTINPEAWQSVYVQKKSLFIHKEAIGGMQYSSAYIPFFNSRNEMIGSVNLPYFSQHDVMKKEISEVLVTFTNIYILLILFSVFITLLISNHITYPLTLLAKTMSGLKLGHNNEKINWTQSDEIGQLVQDYNRMVGELNESAALLARSERESAWREMARQVAHEIKNPLTPMKLNVQYLEKAWKEKAPDWDQRLERFTRVLTEQIDTLSVIASGFSDFARMPPENRERLDLAELIRDVMGLYKDTTPVGFELTCRATNSMVRGDRKQLFRVFTNLINNAIQSISVPSSGKITILLENKDDYLIIRIIDNGSGIPADRQQFIFRPEFTTKSGGMGLGLAIVKGVVENLEGTISFTSVENVGTEFLIKLPNDTNENEKK